MSTRHLMTGFLAQAIPAFFPALLVGVLALLEALV